MAQQTIQQPAQPKRGFRYSFKRSTWITAGWNWFLMFAGKAAEPVLTVSVIYSCARLLPAVHFPVQIDNVVFLCQMVALDIGGLGLRKLANQARRDGNEDGATLAGRVSNALITIMCINVGLSILQSIAHLPGNWIAVIEGILLVARAILAVLYSFVIHSLHPSQDDPQPHDGHPQPDIQGLIDQALANQKQHFDQTLADQANDFERRLAAVKPESETIRAEYETKLSNEVERLRAENETKLSAEVERLRAEMERRIAHLRVSLTAETRQHETRNETMGPRLVPLPTRPVSPKPEEKQPDLPESGQQEAPSLAESANCKAAVYALLEQDNSLQPIDIARRINQPRTTVWRHWDKWHKDQAARGQSTQGAQVERDETAS